MAADRSFGPFPALQGWSAHGVPVLLKGEGGGTVPHLEIFLNHQEVVCACFNL